MSEKMTVIYVTTSKFKEEENKLFGEHCKLADGRVVKEAFEFDFRPVAIPEILEVSIERIVQAEVREAYARVRVPCIVEHAGLIFEDFRAASYPGGLTKP